MPLSWPALRFLVQQPGIVNQEDNLYAVVEVELAQNRRDMGLRVRRTEMQGGPDVGIRQSMTNGNSHLSFSIIEPRGEPCGVGMSAVGIGLRGTADHLPHPFWGEHWLAGRRPAYRGNDLLRCGVFEQNPAAPNRRARSTKRSASKVLNTITSGAIGSARTVSVAARPSMIGIWMSIKITFGACRWA
jgi:hypothetical protein